jgi:RNA polymerase sigma factor (sigma-70 family)
MKRRPRFGFGAHGAESDFERLLRPHIDHLYKLAYRFTGSADRAEDLIQDLLVRIYPRRAELERIDQLRPWLVRVMYRIFVDQKRRDARAPYVAIAESEVGDTENGDPYGAVADESPGPDIEFEHKLNREHLLRAWEQLSDEHKALLALFEIEGYSLNEIESLLDVTLGTLKSRLHRARARLAHLLATEPLPAGERVKDKREA